MNSPGSAEPHHLYSNARFIKHSKNSSNDLKATDSTLDALEGKCYKVDPATLVVSQYAMRQPSSADDKVFVKLKKLIKDAGGNATHVQVRRKVPGSSKPDDFTLEVISGHRILQACQELELQVAVSIVDDLCDKAFAKYMALSNAGRKSPGAWESGLGYRQLLDGGVFKSQAELARELYKSPSDVSNALALANLPDVVVQAFATPRALRHAHAKPLKDALKKNEAGVLVAAEKLVEQQAKLARKIPSKEVLKTLVACASTPSDPAEVEAGIGINIPILNRSQPPGSTTTPSAGSVTTNSSSLETGDQALNRPGF